MWGSPSAIIFEAREGEGGRWRRRVEVEERWEEMGSVLFQVEEEVE